MANSSSRFLRTCFAGLAAEHGPLDRRRHRCSLAANVDDVERGVLLLVMVHSRLGLPDDRIDRLQVEAILVRGNAFEQRRHDRPPRTHVVVMKSERHQAIGPQFSMGLSKRFLESIVVIPCSLALAACPTFNHLQKLGCLKQAPPAHKALRQSRVFRESDPITFGLSSRHDLILAVVEKIISAGVKIPAL